MHVDVCQTHCQYSCEGRLGQKQGQNNLRFVDLEINSPLYYALVSFLVLVVVFRGGGGGGGGGGRGAWI